MAKRMARFPALPTTREKNTVLTRGYFIGEIVDSLAILGSQVKMRNSLHLFDLTVTTENFFRDLLNVLMGKSFRNLNAERSNEPGLDLGDETARIAVQVTSSATTTKVNKTLENITEEQRAKYDTIIVLRMNRRQGSYSIDPDLASKYGFKEGDGIWDLDTLARKAMDLEIDDLQSLYNLVRSNTARLKIELEVPDEDGNYPTSGYDLWERVPRPKLGDGKAFCEYVEKICGEAPNPQEIEEAIAKLAARLSRLPRLTREFLAMLYERRETRKSRRFGDGSAHLLHSSVQRLYHGDDLWGELDILEHGDFLSRNGEDPGEYGPPEIGMIMPTQQEDLQLSFLKFVVEKRLGFRAVIGSVDFSAF